MRKKESNGRIDCDEFLWELGSGFSLFPVEGSGGKFALRIPSTYDQDGIAWCADEVGSGLNCNREKVSVWEQFEFKHMGKNKVAFKGGRAGKWCTMRASKRIVCDSTTLGTRETFEWHQIQLVQQ